MIQNVLRTLGGISNYGVISLLIFAGVFTGVIVWLCLQKRSYLDRMARIPLEPDHDQSPDRL